MNLGIALAGKGRLEEAIAEYRKAMELAPNKPGIRYGAACAAALAGGGRLTDAKPLDDKERARWRKRALDWLRADLALRTKQLASGQPADRAQVRQQMMHWQQDGDLAAIRDKAALAQRPADERQACEKLWADVAALLKKAGEETK
jgi:serine/threonine-protein kinase